jgi:hypothetical protein
LLNGDTKVDCNKWIISVNIRFLPLQSSDSDERLTMERLSHQFDVLSSTRYTNTLEVAHACFGVSHPVEENKA